MEMLLKNARLVDFSMDTYGDIYIKEGKIAQIGENLEFDCKTVDCKGKVLMPSFIDLHCHFREPGYTHKETIESGSKAAVRGGYTAVNLMANTNPICSSLEVAKLVTDKAKEIGLIDAHQVLSITKNFEGDDISHLQDINNEIKIISDDGKGVNSSKTMYEAMLIAKEKDIIVMSHAEDSDFSAIDMRIAEDLMTLRDVELAKITGAKLHMAHVSTVRSMEYIIAGRESGAKITCEVTPHHIALTTDESNYRVNPPIRNKEDKDCLIEAIKRGYVDAIGTDHAPHTKEDKEKGAPGMSGIETAFSVCYTELVKKGHISLSKLSDIMSKRPGEIIGMNKGKFTIGMDGDLVLVDLEPYRTINAEEFESKGKNTPFHGKAYYGEVLMTIKAGKVVYRNK